MTGTVVGLLPEIDVARVDVTLDPGESLLFYTDGATEARTLDGLLVGEERLSALFEATMTVPPTGSPHGWPRRSST